MRHYKGLFFAINIVFLCCLRADGKSKYYDGEDKPYEFGFNIEGEQHRHEKKDENGLIMGEFGFITADGVYHVTVYATDENGNFKIVSMKNIRVKPYPSGPGGAKKGASPERKGNSLPLPPAQPQPVPQRPPQPVAQRPQQPQPQTQKPLPIASPAKSCSHCSLPTTTTQAPRNQNIPANNFNTPSQITQNQPSYGGQIRPNTPSTGFEAPAISGQQPGYSQQGGLPSQPNTFGNQPGGQNIGAGGQSNYAPSGPGQRGGSQQGGFGSGPQQGSAHNYPEPGAGPQYSSPNAPPTGTGARNPKKYDNEQNLGADQPYNPQGGFGGTLQSPLGPNKPILVSANMERVDSNTDVNKRGSGEKEGLPDKLNKNDMMLLLYTFNYTLGFHAHHEEGYTNGAKKGYYYVTGRNGIRTRVDYVADETGFHPKITQEVFDTLSEEVPKPETEKDEKYGLKGYEFKWIYYPVDSKLR